MSSLPCGSASSHPDVDQGAGTRRGTIGGAVGVSLSSACACGLPTLRAKSCNAQDGAGDQRCWPACSFGLRHLNLRGKEFLCHVSASYAHDSHCDAFAYGQAGSIPVLEVDSSAPLAEHKVCLIHLANRTGQHRQANIPEPSCRPDFRQRSVSPRRSGRVEDFDFGVLITLGPSANQVPRTDAFQMALAPQPTRPSRGGSAEVGLPEDARREEKTQYFMLGPALNRMDGTPPGPSKLPP